MYYKGILPKEFKNQRFVTILEKPIECINENFKGADLQPDTQTMAKTMAEKYSIDLAVDLSYKPRVGLWGSFDNYCEHNGQSICGWEYWHISNGYEDTKNPDSSFSFPNGVFGITYKLPKDAKVLIIDESNFAEKKQLLIDYDFDVKKMMKDVDVIIQTSYATPYDIPSICITNYETFQKLEIIDNWTKEYFDSPKQYFIKNGELCLEDKELIVKKIEIDSSCFEFLPEEIKNDKEIFLECIDKGIVEIYPFANDSLKYNPEIIDGVIKSLQKFDCVETFDSSEFRKYPNELIELINIHKEEIKNERLEQLNLENNIELDDQ